MYRGGRFIIKYVVMGLFRLVEFSKKEVRGVVQLAVVVLIALFLRCFLSVKGRVPIAYYDLPIDSISNEIDALDIDASVKVFADSLPAKIPAKSMEPTSKVYPAKRSQKKRLMVELNRADSTQLRAIRGIGAFRSAQIVKYRGLLGGYVLKSQLLEVYSIDEEAFNLIEDFVSVDSSRVTKIDIERCSFKELLRHPYSSYEMTKMILNKRSSGGCDESSIIQEDSIMGRKLLFYLKGVNKSS